MAFEKFKTKAEELKDISGEMAGVATEKVNQLLDDLNEAIPIMNALGLSIKDFKVGMGAIPEIEAKLTGSIDAIDVDKIQELKEKNQDNKILIPILKGLETASNFKERLGELVFKGVEVNMKLGLPPKISVGFIE